MREEHINKLIEKYKAGLTSLDEEKMLLENDESLMQTKSYIKSKKVEVPENLNDQLWDAFDEKITDRKWNPIYKWSIAAAVVLLVAFYTNFNHQKKQEELRKQALLEEAKNMFFTAEESLKVNKILFEDENLIVYTKIEK